MNNWNLEKYFFSGMNDPKIQESIDKAVEAINTIAGYKGKLKTADAQLLLDYLNDSDKISKYAHPVFIYLQLLQSQNTQNSEVSKRLGEIGNVFTQESQKTMFADDELKELGLDRIEELAKDPLLAEYENYFKGLVKNLKYSLAEGEEKVLSQVSQPLSLFTKMYSELTGNFVFIVDGKELTRDELGALLESDDEETRKAARQAYLDVFGNKNNQIVLGSIYTAVCKKNVANIKNRNIPSVMYVRNNSEDMEEDVVNTLMDQVFEQYPLYQRFLRFKAASLGKKQLDVWDLSAPFPGIEDKKVSYEEGVAQYLGVIEKFDPEFLAYSQDMINNGRVDVYPAKGKRSGAFAQYTKGVESFVLLNYTDTFRDVMTLAHELGHAIHGNLSQVQNATNFSSPLCLAETASIFNEQLVFEDHFPKLDTEEKAYYLCKRLDDIFSTMFRQVMYVRFEKQAHQAFLDGKELTYHEYNTMWSAELALLYGDTVKLTPEMGVGWSSIPHIYKTPFYCYAYSFGMALSFSLYGMYTATEDKAGFMDIYKGILRSGGAVPPKELLAKYDLDITKPEFYHNAFRVIDGLLNDLEAIGHEQVTVSKAKNGKTIVKKGDVLIGSQG